MDSQEFGESVQKILAQYGISCSKVEVVMTSGAQVSSYLEKKEFNKLEEYLLSYCKHYSLTLKELFLAKGGSPNRNGDDFDSIPLQQAAIAMWDQWPIRYKMATIQNSLDKGVPLETMLTDECEQVREGAKLYADRQIC